MRSKIGRKLNIMEVMNNTLKEKYKNKIINGALLSAEIQSTLTKKMSTYNFNSLKSISPPKLKVILVGDKMDSKIYVENKLKMCKTIGIEGELVHFPNNTQKSKILDEIQNSNEDKSIHGIIVQLPLPENLNLSRTEILSKVDLNKDVDGLNPLNQGKILQMNLSECLLPPTAMGVLELLRLAIDYSNDLDLYKKEYLSKNIFNDQPVNLAGLDVTVLGRGLTAGLPLSILLQKCNGTITTCHSKTKDLPGKCKNADILISAVGKSNLVHQDLVKDDCIIIDVGINVKIDNEGNKIVTGDVEFNEIIDRVKYITPVPGGVGKMTVIMLLKNVIKAWGSLNKIELNN